MGFKAFPECPNIFEIMCHALGTKAGMGVQEKNSNSPASSLILLLLKGVVIIKGKMVSGRVLAQQLKTDKIMEGKAPERSDERI